MATSSQAAPTATAAADGSDDTRSNPTKTIFGSHVFTIDGFSATKDLGVGKSIRSSTFFVGGHGWYVDCFPCGVDEESACWVSLFLRRQDDNHGSRVSGYCDFTLMKSRIEIIRTITFGDEGKRSVKRRSDNRFVRRNKLESLLRDDCFQVRCIVFIPEFAAVAQPDDLATESVTGSQLLTLDGYAVIRGAHDVGQPIEFKFRFGGHSWYMGLFPYAEDEEDALSAYFSLVDPEPPSNYEVKVRLEITLLTHAGQIISSIQYFLTFSSDSGICDYLSPLDLESSLRLQDAIQIRCDLADVKGITATPYLRQGIAGDLQGSQQVKGDVTFEVGGHRFAAHKYILSTRCAAFMAEFFGPPGKDVTNQPVHIIDMEPRVFEALLHFIYTDTLPEVNEEDKVGVAQGLLVAADRFAMVRLKLICGDMLCNYINDARVAVDTLELAVKHCCHKLGDACKKFLIDNLATVAP